MRWLAISAILATGMLGLTATANAQDCENLTIAHLSGTYTMSGSGYVDLDKLMPGLGLPSGLTKVYWLGAHTVDPEGRGTGWVTFNAGGFEMTADLVDPIQTMQPGCRIESTFSMKIRGLGLTFGPFRRVIVPVLKPGAAEMRMITGGSEPGNPPRAMFDTGAAYRISMKY